MTTTKSGEDSNTAPPALDYEAIKRKQQSTWTSGDFSVVASRIVYYAEHLVESADLQAGWRVLDVATGSGNAAIAAARRGCVTTGIDYVATLLERARRRADAEHLRVEFSVADAEDLPFKPATFDAVISIFGVMFAPNHPRAAAELVRVCKPGGCIALASWVPDGYVGETFRALGRCLPPMPGLIPPIRWGEEEYLKSLFGDSIASIRSQRRTTVFRFCSAEENVDFFRTHYGPALKAFEAIAPPERDSLRAELVELSKRYDRNGGKGPIAIVGEYLESVITTR